MNYGTTNTSSDTTWAKRQQVPLTQSKWCSLGKLMESVTKALSYKFSQNESTSQTRMIVLIHRLFIGLIFNDLHNAMITFRRRKLIRLNWCQKNNWINHCLKLWGLTHLVFRQTSSCVKGGGGRATVVVYWPHLNITNLARPISFMKSFWKDSSQMSFILPLTLTISFDEPKSVAFLYKHPWRFTSS